MSKTENNMKFHTKKTTITIYFLLFLLWMTLFINATEDQTQMIIENLSNDIQDKVPQCFFQNIFLLLLFITLCTTLHNNS